jgi:hypothetical protein
MSNNHDSPERIAGPEKESAEQRREARVRCESEVTLENLEKIGFTGGRMANYGSGGFYFESNTFLTPGSIIFVGIADSPYCKHRDTYECHRVQIRWIRALHDSKYRFGYGVQHLDPIRAYESGNEEYFYDIPKYLKLILTEPRETRRHKRKAATKAVYFAFERGRSFGRGTIGNFSGGGMYIETKTLLPAGRVIYLVIPGTRYDRGVMVKARVVHAGSSGIGVQVTGIIKCRT